MEFRTNTRLSVSIALVVLVTSCATPVLPDNETTREGHGASEALRVDALENATEAIGLPYVWGANGPDEFDCSGLIVWAYQRAYGDSRIFRGRQGLQRDMAMDGFFRTGTIPVELHDLSPGDIIFITSSRTRITHGGLFADWADSGEIEFIHASSYYGSVVVDTFPVTGRVRGQWYVGGGRLLLPE